MYIIFDHDVATKKILGDSRFTTGDDYIPGALIKNVGRNTESFDVTCKIFDFENVLLYNNTQTVTVLEPDSAQITDFEPYTLQAANNLYNVIVYTSLQGDMDTSNDTLSKYINTYTTGKNNVVLEIATGTWCPYCPGAAMGADDLIANGHNVAVIEYHGGDKYENTNSATRIDYYSIRGYPTAVFDGIEFIVGGYHNQSMYQNYLPKYNERKIIRTAFDIEIFGQAATETDYNLTIRINKLGPALNKNLVLQVALTESEIQESWQGQNKLDFVERLMIPDANGSRIDINPTESIDVPLNFTKDISWITDHCELVAFIQDISTKEILQAEKQKLSDLMPISIDDNDSTIPLTTKLRDNYPNPFNPTTTISYTLEAAGKITLAIFNIKGQKVKTLVKDFKDAGEYSVFWDGKDDTQRAISSGVYFYKLQTDKHTFTKKMLLIK